MHGRPVLDVDHHLYGNDGISMARATPCATLRATPGHRPPIRAPVIPEEEARPPAVSLEWAREQARRLIRSR